MTESRLWIDVTDLIGWRRRKTGTQRVVHELISAYSSLRDIGLFYFDQRVAMFFDVQPGPFLAKAAHHDDDDEIGVPVRPTSVGAVARMRARRARFRRSDQLLILGGDWRRRGFLGRLSELRPRIGGVHHFVHDVMPITMPHLFPAHESADCLAYLSEAFRTVDTILTSSRWNVEQIGSLTDAGVLAGVPVHAVGLGTTSLVNVAPRRPPVDLPTGFALSVGTFELKKNRRAIYQAYKLRTASDRLAPLVIAGQPGGMPDDGVYLLRHDPLLADLVYVLNDVSDAQLCWLYENCAYTIYGSLAEGWGVPIDESLSFGAPCLCSGTAAMPEVGGHAAQYFDAQDPSALLALMRRAAKPDELRRWSERISTEYRPRTWTNVCRAIDSAI